ncbi:MAG: S26 family signal peptidase [Betaproteobacteria bacterium AqS2]|uniref:signal peptidase I n=1 Tax=Candidatus Amphirhobacter heronislandensis TaxID=1732024 RepID=A0A930Y1Z2_9GAMM|nr:S26 family signal peptidase [Betaproteobacteria bacterium AqS2]
MLILVASVVAIAAIQERWRLGVNVTDSLPGQVFLIDAGRRDGPFVRGEVVAFRFDGSRWGYPADAVWAKRVAGLPGERVAVVGGVVFVAGARVAVLDPGVLARGGVKPLPAGAVPPGMLFVLGASADSFDSRYAEFGFLPEEDVLGVLRTLW